MNRTGRIALLPVLVALAAGCGVPAAAPPAAPTFTLPPVPTVALPTPTPAPTPTQEAAAVPAAPAAPTSWVMPDLVGSNLQEAQDAIQSLTDFGIPITKSHDTTGEDRNQILDANWKVCDQNVDPGAEITSGTLIDFGVVKTDERC